MPAQEPEKLLTPAEVAAMFRVDSKTVTRWSKKGILTSFRTPGGHRRFRESEVRALIAGTDTKAALSMDGAERAEDAAAARVLSGLLGHADTSVVVLSGRCGDCGYLLTSPGHETACG